MDCNHKWVNMEGCLLCGKGWEALNKEGYFFKAVDSPKYELPKTFQYKDSDINKR